MSRTMQVPGCRGTTVRKVTRAHRLQFLEVNIKPGGEVPLHKHNCAATMVITRGSARKLTGKGLGELVKPGDVVVKAANEPHGFTKISKGGFQFISLSGRQGIVRKGGKLDLAFA